MTTKPYTYEWQPLAHPDNVVQGAHYRITVLTSRLLRLEQSATGVFEDHPSQRVWFRNLGKVNFTVRRTAGGIELRTDDLLLSYDEQPFSAVGLSAHLLAPSNSCQEGWYYGKATKNLGGTARTLDEVNGACPLEDGVLAWDGFAVLEDSDSLLLEGDWIAERQDGSEDFYLFAYGHDYQAALDDFYRITGDPPMLPRYALGNWWSRYYPYSEESYQALMRRFDQEGIPFSVGVIDMDWHLVDIDPKYGGGWTGYTWNRALFPDPPRLLSWLHDRGMKVTLNVHPALGVRAYEDCYPTMAAHMGIDPATEEPILFDVTDPQFLRYYLEDAHHPLEQDGVDFWWIDWQQGTRTKIKGLDPLWMLNHIHFLDSGRSGKRPMTFSRYAGPGSHRYPVGFSGDTVISWESLDFQHYFTATAANIGYGWWSHDIGGHMLGTRDDELEARWYQLGAFSPINRLHSTNFHFAYKEPWKFRTEVRLSMDQFLRLRHEMIPYLYTMNHKAYAEHQPLVRPLYYQYPDEPNAYPMEMFTKGNNPNAFLFGDDFVVCPITTPMNPVLQRGKVRAWLPEGLYHDFFTGLCYTGGRFCNFFRPIHQMPVFVKAGAILPFTTQIFGQEFLHNPTELTVHLFGGADGSFTLYEDDNETNAYRAGVCATTDMTLDWEKGVFTIHPANGDLDLLPQKRRITLVLHGIAADSFTLAVNGKELPAAPTKGEGNLLSFDAVWLAPTETLTLTMANAALAPNDTAAMVEEITNAAQVRYRDKENIYEILQKDTAPVQKLAEMHGYQMDAELLLALEEVLSAR